MDKTHQKDDKVKIEAAKNSADFAFEIINSGILDSFLS